MCGRQIRTDQARQADAKLGLGWTKLDLDQFRHGLEMEPGHGARDPESDVADNNPVPTGRIAWAHPKEPPGYSTRLDRPEADAQPYWASRLTHADSHTRALVIASS